MVGFDKSRTARLGGSAFGLEMGIGAATLSGTFSVGNGTSATFANAQNREQLHGTFWIAALAFAVLTQTPSWNALRRMLNPWRVEHSVEFHACAHFDGIDSEEIIVAVVPRDAADDVLRLGERAQLGL